MRINFSFADGTNPYIAKDNKTLWKMVQKYYLEQTGNTSFNVIGKATVWTVNRSLTDYQKKQTLLREFAIDWQASWTDFCYSYSEISDWYYFFEEYGKKYGLLREFRENCIC